MSRFLLIWRFLSAALVFTVPAVPSADAGTRFVSPDGKDGNNGTVDSPCSLATANASAKPGDTIVLLDGVYRGTPIAPARSGKQGEPITYQAANAGEAVLTESRAMSGPFPDDDSDSPAAIFLLHRSHIVVDGIRVKDPGGRFLYAGGASFIAVQNCHFENTEYPRAWESCRFKGVGDHITFRNNVVKKGNDSVAITGGSFHLIEGNTFDNASHSCLTLQGVHRSVVRGNKFTNPYQKLMEVLSARRRDVGDAIRKSEYVVIEDNFLGPAPLVEANGTDSGSGSAGIQYAGNNCILRRNVYFKCGMGMDFTYYDAGYPGNPEALYCSHNRFYNNTVYDCGWPARYGSGPGVWISGGQDGIEDNVLINNVLYRNHAHPDAHFPASTPYDVQLAFADPDSFRLLRNLLMGRQGGQVTVWDKRQRTGFTLSAFEDQFPQTARGNLEAEPEFADAEKGDFHLKEGSPCIDAGMPLTRARSAGKGTVIEVEDALYFSDGHGIVDPDVVRVGTERVRVLSVDCRANSMILDRSISWQKGESVTLDYAGKGPDLGAVECHCQTGEMNDSLSVRVIRGTCIPQKEMGNMCPSTLTLFAAAAIAVVVLCAGASSGLSAEAAPPAPAASTPATPPRAPGFPGDTTRVTVRPREIDDVLSNPGMGFETMGRFDAEVEGYPRSTIAYFRWGWRAIEPENGAFRWDIVDDTIEKAKAHGQRVSVAMMPDSAPKWYRDLGAKGWDYPSGRGDRTSWMPDHNDPLYLKHWGRLVRELGKRYDGNPNINHVDLRSLGRWGEWHFYGVSQVPGFVDATPETRRELVDMYLESFKKTPLLMLIGPIDELRYAVANGAGWRADCLGDLGFEDPGSNWNHMRDRYQQNLDAAAANDAWKHAPVAFESCGVMQTWADSGYDLEFIFNEALRWHCSILNNKSSAVPPRWWGATEAFLKRMGYRFVLRSMTHPSQVEAGGALQVETEWDNIGVAPPYRKYLLAWKLTPMRRRGESTHLQGAAEAVDVTAWLPGRHDASLEVAIPKDAAPGRYHFSLALLEPSTREPAVQLAIEGRDAQGWYCLSDVDVVAAKSG